MIKWATCQDFAPWFFCGAKMTGSWWIQNNWSHCHIDYFGPSLLLYGVCIISSPHENSVNMSATRQITSPQFPSFSVQFGVSTTLEGKSHLEGETFVVSTNTLNRSPISTVPSVTLPWWCIRGRRDEWCQLGNLNTSLKSLVSAPSFWTIIWAPKDFSPSQKIPTFSSLLFFQKTLDLKQTFQQTKNDISSQKIPHDFFWNKSQFFRKLRTFGTSKKQQRLGNHTTVGAAKVGGGGSCPGCTITPTTSEVLDEKWNFKRHQLFWLFKWECELTKFTLLSFDPGIANSIFYVFLWNNYPC